MSEKMSHDQYVISVCQQIAETAQAMLDGELSYLLGARKLPMLCHEAETKNDDADFIAFVSIDLADCCRLYPTVAVWRPMSAAAAPKAPREPRLSGGNLLMGQRETRARQRSSSSTSDATQKN